MTVPDLYTALQSDHDRAWELMNSLSGGARDDPPAPGKRRSLAQELVRLLSAHELTEELLVWPAVRRFCEDGEELAAVALKQGKELRWALNELSSITPSQEFDECVDTVAGQLRTHFSYEQSQAWPRLSDALPQGECEALAAGWLSARATAATKRHPHLPPQPRVLGVVMPLLSVLDRLMEAVTSRAPLRRA